jgi:hypothetical protein
VGGRRPPKRGHRAPTAWAWWGEEEAAALTVPQRARLLVTAVGRKGVRQGDRLARTGGAGPFVKEAAVRAAEFRAREAGRAGTPDVLEARRRLKAVAKAPGPAALAALGPARDYLDMALSLDGPWRDPAHPACLPDAARLAAEDPATLAAAARRAATLKVLAARKGRAPNESVRLLIRGLAVSWVDRGLGSPRGKRFERAVAVVLEAVGERPRADLGDLIGRALDRGLPDGFRAALGPGRPKDAPGAETGTPGTPRPSAEVEWKLRVFAARNRRARRRARADRE